MVLLVSLNCTFTLFWIRKALEIDFDVLLDCKPLNPPKLFSSCIVPDLIENPQYKLSHETDEFQLVHLVFEALLCIMPRCQLSIYTPRPIETPDERSKRRICVVLTPDCGSFRWIRSHFGRKFFRPGN